MTEILNAEQLSKRSSLKPIPQHELAIEYVDVKKLKLYPGNARKGDVDKIAKSIEINGMYQAVIVQRSTGFIIVGNHRFKAAKQVGLQKVPVSYVDVDDDRARKIALVDNKSSDDAEYDNEALVLLFEEMGDDIEGSGWDGDEIAQIIAELEDNTPDFDPEEDDDVRLDRKNVTDCPNCGHTFEPTTRSELA
ncbi:DNA binding protein [Arthrobacter phage BarretLemon]|uniref:DNA binding protein n=1 Tax=Arthrobacter phage BarretLemon TaxID=1796994 RepID=A0A140G796_9CAUD|nr:ParB-like partition protein [Arthrobacter phage BarretLemon]AMM44531.1 DNA binding protein [Arthrobacter phage BarretLemon]